MSELSIYDKRRDCVERWHLGDPAAAVDMATEIARLRIIEEHAGYVRDTIETLSVGHTTNAETLRRALRLVVKAYDENVS